MRPWGDAVALAVVFALIPAWAIARAGMVLTPHPGWIAVLVVSARHGGSGFLIGLLVAALAVGLGSAVAGAAPWQGRFDTGPDLIALGACILVSWVASWHVRREEELRERLRVVADQAAQSDATIEALREVVKRLRERVDRTSTSLSFLREAAARLEGTDPTAAVEAAADLALARTGACGAAVRVRNDDTEQLLAVRDARGQGELAPLQRHEAQVTVAIHVGHERVGDIALWGLPSVKLDKATTHDLEVIASWCAPAMTMARWLPAGTAGGEWRVL